VKHFKAVGEILKNTANFQQGNLMIGFPERPWGKFKKLSIWQLKSDLIVPLLRQSLFSGTKMTEKLIEEGAMNESDVLYANFSLVQTVFGTKESWLRKLSVHFHLMCLIEEIQAGFHHRRNYMTYGFSWIIC